MKSKRGRKIIAILRIMTEGIITRKELEERTGFSTSEVRNLLLRIQQQNLVTKIERGKVSRRRGKPRMGEYELELVDHLVTTH